MTNYCVLVPVGGEYDPLLEMTSPFPPPTVLHLSFSAACMGDFFLCCELLNVLVEVPSHRPLETFATYKKNTSISSFTSCFVFPFLHLILLGLEHTMRAQV